MCVQGRHPGQLDEWAWSQEGGLGWRVKEYGRHQHVSRKMSSWEGVSVRPPQTEAHPQRRQVHERSGRGREVERQRGRRKLSSGGFTSKEGR